MRQTLLIRLIALAIALLGSLSAPTMALAHASVHEHLAQRHGGDEPPDHDDDHHGNHHGDEPADQLAEHGADARQSSGSQASVRGPSSGDHAHQHPRLDLAQGARDLIRLPAAPESTELVPTVVTIRASLHEVRAPARIDRLLLARPDPEPGPPPTLRAPPIA